MDGRTLHFHLAGINNQNFIMRDEETGSWWQQVSGEAILGPLKGRRLTRVPMDEISFALWKREQPHGRVLRPDSRVSKHYASADWETGIAKLPVTSPIRDKRLDPRELVVGVVVNGHAKAYRMSDVQQQNPIIDTVGGVPIVIVSDGQSVRAFSRLVDASLLISSPVPTRPRSRSPTPPPAANGISAGAQSAARCLAGNYKGSRSCATIGSTGAPITPRQRFSAQD
jgi:hypothetical protein